MTPDQEARCDALAKRIAQLRPDWAQEGMAIRDPNTGRTFRWRANLAAWLPCAWMLDRTLGANVIVRAKCRYASTVEARAIYNGPDWRDTPTLGAILLSLGEEVSITCLVGVWQVDGHRGGARFDGIPASVRAEAILAAKVAQLEAK